GDDALHVGLPVAGERRRPRAGKPLLRILPIAGGVHISCIPPCSSGKAPKASDDRRKPCPTATFRARPSPSCAPRREPSRSNSPSRGRPSSRRAAPPRLVSTQSGRLQAFNHLDKADTFQVDTTVEVSDHTEFDGLLLPGGVANPDYLRTQPKAVEFAKSFFDAGKPVAVICHAGWPLVEADGDRGRSMTSYPRIL